MHTFMAEVTDVLVKRFGRDIRSNGFALVDRSIGLSLVELDLGLEAYPDMSEVELYVGWDDPNQRFLLHVPEPVSQQLYELECAGAINCTPFSPLALVG